MSHRDDGGMPATERLLLLHGAPMRDREYLEKIGEVGIRMRVYVCARGEGATSRYRRTAAPSPLRNEHGHAQRI